MVGLLIPLWIVLRSVYRDRLGAFGCFDDCFNIAGGYFIGLGKRLYSDFFFNHQPIPAYISWAIQTIYQPQSIYELIYRHRMTLIYFFMIADALLVLRFGFAGFAFAMLYETTKGYQFGERFLAEAMIVYPIVYLWGIIMSLTNRQRLHWVESILTAVAAWFIVFSREPYVPLGLFLFGVCLWYAGKARNIALILFSLLSVGTIMFHNPADYWWNVVVANAQSVAGAEIRAQNLAGVGILSIFTYPFSVFWGGIWNQFRMIEAGVSALLVGLLGWLAFRRQWRVLAVTIIALGLGNIRQVAPATLYYGAFHHMVWYALLIAVVTFVIPAKAGIQKLLSWFVFFAIVGYAIFSPESYLRERVDRTAEFQIGYSHYSTQGEIIRRLSKPDHTMFIEEWDELIYWQAKRPSAFRYMWWSSTLAHVPQYRDAKAAMWKNSPPDFYVGLCGREDGTKISLPAIVADQYLRLTQNGKPSCVFIRQEVARTITEDQWNTAKDFSVDTPELFIRHPGL